MAFTGYKIDDDGAGVTFDLDDGRTFRAPRGPAADLEIFRLDAQARRLAQNVSEPLTRAAPAPGSDAGSGTRAPVAPPSMIDAGGPGDGTRGAGSGGPSEGAGGAPGYTPGPGYTPAPPRGPDQSSAPAGLGAAEGQGGAPGAYLDGSGAGAAGGAGPVPRYTAEAPADGGGGAQGAPGAEVPGAAAASSPGPTVGAGAAGGPAGAVRFAGPPPPRGGGGGGGGGRAPAGPTEMLAGRSVSVEGRLSPERIKELEELARREGELAERGLVRQEERTEKDRLEADRQEETAKRYDQQREADRQEGERILGELAERRAAKQREIEESALDPQRLWKGGKGTGNAIAAGLAVALGAFGAALAGGPNAGLLAVEKAIDRDLDLQEKDLDKKRVDLGEIGKVYQLEKERLGDKLAARNEAKIAALTVARARAERFAKMSNAEDAQINLQKVQLAVDQKIAGLRAENEGRIKETRQYRTVMPSTGGGPVRKTTGGVTLLRADGKGGHKAVYLPFPPGLSEGQKSEFMKRAQGANKAQLSLKDIKDKRGSGIPINDEDIQAFAQGFTYRYAEAEGQGQATTDQERSIAAKLRSSLNGGGRAIEAFERSTDQVQEEIIRQLLPPAPPEGE